MSGIAGVIYMDGRFVSPELLRRMADSLAFCGPDAQEIWIDGQAGLGHAMLRTTPESINERQPLSNVQAGVTITADARIDNRAELIDEFGITGFNGNDVPDSELILKAYEKWGTECVHHLLGDFAFAIWDGRQHQLFCARDHFGVKPLCYYSNDKVFVFASEVKGILPVNDVPARLNEARIADFLVEVLEGYDKVSTFYENIFKLPPAHILIVNDRGMQVLKYWLPDPHKQIRLGSDEEYLETFREIFTEAVRCRLRSQSPVGVLLSGGIDSATIWGTATRVNESQEGLLALSGVSPPDKDCIETRLIGEVLDGNPATASQVRWDEVEPYLPEIDKALFRLDDPNDTMMELQRIMYIQAGRSGVKAVLDGIDADVITSTTIHISDLLRKGKLLTAIREARGLSYFFKYYYSPVRLLYRGAKSAFTPFWLRNLIRRFDFSDRSGRAVKNSIIIPDLAERINLNERLKRLDSYRWAQKGFTLADKHALAMNHSNLTVGIERYRRVSAAHAIEARHPFLDKRLAEFCLSLPWDQKIYRGWTKILMRRMMKGVIPESVRWRRGREHLGWQFSNAIIAHRQDMLRNAIATNLNSLSNYINPVVLKRICTQTVIGDSDNGGYALLQAGALGLFLEHASARS